MTYHNKLLLKKWLKIAGVAILVVLVLLLFFFSYLNKYLVYDEYGAHFSFHESSEETERTSLSTSPPEAPVLVIGSAVQRAEDEMSGVTSLDASEVRGLLVDFETLQKGETLNAIELTDFNTLILELRLNGSELLTSKEIDSLILRAQMQNIHLIAMIGCLNDREYALEHASDALHIQGGALWIGGSGGTYFLNPGSEGTQDYIIGMVNELATRGFEEVILENFEYPASEYIVDSTGEESRDTVLINAYRRIDEETTCTLGLLVTNPNVGHQAFNAAEHLYVYFSSGTNIKSYMERHDGYHVVLITDSHDTRFDDYGKIMTEQPLVSEEETGESEEETADEADDDAG